MPNCIPNNWKKIGVFLTNIGLGIGVGVGIGAGRFKSLNIFSLLNFLDEQCPLRDQIL